MTMLINPYVFGASANVGPQEVTFTVPWGTVAESLTDFPTMVRLSDLPLAFWNNVKEDGGDIRATNEAGTVIPHDLSRFDYDSRDGVLWVQLTLVANGDTVFKITCGHPELSVLPANDVNGREAVWADYEAVYLMGHDIIDRTGKSSSLYIYGDPDLFDEVATSGDINCHEGVATDGSYYYGFDSASIRKFDMAWSAVATNSAVGTGTGNPGINNLGGGCAVNGILYVTADASGVQYLAKYSALDLSFIEAFNIESFASAAADFCYNPDDGLIYTIPYITSPGTTSIVKIDPADGSNQGTITLDTAIIEAQGITLWRGAFWITSDDTDETFRVEMDGTVSTGAAGGLFGPRTLPTSWEGLDVSPDGEGLIVLDDGGATEVVRTFKPFDRDLSGGGGMEVWADARLVGTLSSTGALGTSWTVGASFQAADTTQRAFLGLSPTGAYDATKNVHCYSDNVGGSVINLSVFDGDNGFFYTDPAQVVSTSAMQRMNLIYDGTTARRLFYNGGSKGTDTTITARGLGITHLVIGGTVENADVDAWRGYVGFVYARPGTLSDAWIAAEYANMNAPSSFYLVGTITTVTDDRAPAGDMQSGSDRRVPAGDMNSGSDFRIWQERS